MRIVNDPVRIKQGGTASLQLEINAKNDFLPTYRDGLSVVLDAGLKGQLGVRSTGRLLGGRSRITLAASPDTPLGVYQVRVVLVVPTLGVLLTAEAGVEVGEPAETGNRRGPTGGQPDIDVRWVAQANWVEFDPPWNGETVGSCDLYRDQHLLGSQLTKVEWTLNEDFAPLQRVIQAKRLGEQALKFSKKATSSLCSGGCSSKGWPKSSGKRLKTTMKRHLPPNTGGGSAHG